MKSSDDSDLKNTQKVLSMLSSSNTLSLATINAEQEAEVSLIPFYYDDNQFWIFVSSLSAHTQHLFNHPCCSVLIYQNETSPKNPFAVERLSISCVASVEESNKDRILDEMANKLGSTLSLLRQLGDFYLISLRPIQGRFIAGFGQAFDMIFDDGSHGFKLKHIDPSKKN